MGGGGVKSPKIFSVFKAMINDHIWWKISLTYYIREGVQKNRFFLGKSPKLWVGGGQES